VTGKIPVSDVGFVVHQHRDEIDSAINRVLDSGWFILGPEVEAFEAAFAEMVGVHHAIAVASGTDAVELALRAVGVTRGDLVITVSHTATATATGVQRAEAVPCFVDVERDRLTMDANALDRILSDPPPSFCGGQVKAILPVHIYGMPADMDSIRKVASAHGVPVVEDAAQAHGASIGGRRVGSYGAAGAFSFYPTKNLGALGDAGMIVTDSDDVASSVRLLRQYGWASRFVSAQPGANSRMDELQAAILSALLPHLGASNDHRRRIAAVYDEALDNTDVTAPVVVRPWSPPGAQGISCVYHQYVVRLPDGSRDRVQKSLSEEGIGTAVHYPVPLHMQPTFEDCPAGDLACTEEVSRRILSLPIGDHVTESDAKRVAASLTRSVYSVVHGT
jgi:dTDP-4-amino-4,6-dideoxygalactose transaminase